MVSPTQRSHEDLTALYLRAANRASIHAAAYAATLPHWVNVVHPGTLDAAQVTTMPTGYLADLYPIIAAHGPRGETYIRQLVTLQTHLNNIHDDIADHTFLDAINNDLLHVEHAINAPGVLDTVYFNAVSNGLPLPGDDTLYGINQRDRGANWRDYHPAEDLIDHIIWSEFKDDEYPFQRFLYHFAFISLNHETFEMLASRVTAVQQALTAYATFCTRWEIPQ